MGEIWSTCIMAHTPLCGCGCSSASSTLCTQNSPPRQKGVPNLCVQLCTVVSKSDFPLSQRKIWSGTRKTGPPPSLKKCSMSCHSRNFNIKKNNICKTIGYKITVIQRVSFSTSLQVIDLTRHPKVSAYQISFFRQCTISYSMAKKCKFTFSIQDQNQKFLNKKKSIIALQSLR